MCGQLAYLPRDSFVMVYLSVMFFPVHTLAANFCAAQRTLRHVRAHERVCGHEPGTLDYRGIEGHSVRTGHDGMAAGRSASQPLQVKFALLQARPHRLTAHCVAAFRLPLAPPSRQPGHTTTAWIRHRQCDRRQKNQCKTGQLQRHWPAASDSSKDRFIARMCALLTSVGIPIETH